MISSHNPSRHFLLIGFVAGLFTLLVASSWVGYISSDDGIYLSQALVWGDGEAHLPTSHWGFRYPVVFALTGAVAAFGDNTASVATVSIMYSLLLLGAVYVVMSRFVSASVALLSIGLAATWPLLVIKSSVISADIPEAFFAILSVALFVEATRHESPSRYLFISGLLAGFMMLTRETGAGLGLVYAILFFSGAYFDRKLYLWGALGILCVLGLEAAYYLSQGESVLYRFATIVESHGSVELTSRDFSGGIGNVSDDRFFGPILALLVNQEVGLMFYFTIPAAWFLLRKASLEGSERVLAQVLTLLVCVWVLWISYSGAIRPMPRYYSVAAVASIMLTAMWLYYLPNRRRATWFAVLFVVSNLIALSLENTHPRFASRTLATYVKFNDVVVYTDQRTYNRTVDVLRWSPPEHRAQLREGVPPIGALLFNNPNVNGFTPEMEDEIRARVASKELESIKVWQPPRRGIGHILGFLGLEALVPEKYRQRLIYGNRAIELLRVADLAP